VKTELPDVNNAPDVLAYRVGQLEIAVATGFRELKSELAAQRSVYATKVELADAKAICHEEHQRRDADITVIQKWLEWATRIVIGAVIVAVLALVVGPQVIK
jgi:hypothetical protein